MSDHADATILLVDDEPLVLKTLTDQLQELGFQVSTASTGDEAYDMVCNGIPFDLLLTDVRMPGRIDGFELIKLVQQAKPGARTMAMSGWVGAENFGTQQQHRFLSKPFTHARLARELNELMAR